VILFIERHFPIRCDT